MRTTLVMATVAALGACAAPVDDTPRAYVVHVLEMPGPTDGASAGVDHDGSDAGGGSTSPDARCDARHPDYRSRYDERAGIDASFNEVVPTFDALLEDGQTIDGAIAARVASGELLVAFEVVRGPPRTVTAYLVDPTDALRLDPDGRLAAGQTFAVRSELGAGQDAYAGDRAVARLGDFPVAIPLVSADLGGLFPVPMRAVEVRFDDGDEALRRGELGAVFDVEELIAALPPSGGIVPDDHDVIRDMADVAPREDDPTRCANLSIGLAFEAVPAHLERSP